MDGAIEMDLIWNLMYCGRVYVDDTGLFTFVCNECTEELTSGRDLEVHIRSHLRSKSETGKISIAPSPHQNAAKAKQGRFQSLQTSTPIASTTEYTCKVHHSDDDIFDDRVSTHSISCKEESGDRFDSPDTIETRSADNVCFEGDDEPIVRIKKRKVFEVLQCDICQSKIRGKYNMRIHMKHSHMNESDIPVCSVCNKKVKYLQSHMLMHKTKKRHQCNQCGASYATNSLLTVHYRKHTGERPYVCFKCGLSFVSGTKLSIHMKKHSDEKPFKCEHCGFCFRERYVMRNHIEHVHSGKRPYACDTCNKTFSSRKALGQHQNLHVEKKFACKFCDQKFAQGSGRRGHEKRVHGAI